MKKQEEYQISQQVKQIEKQKKSAEVVIIQPTNYQIGLAYLSSDIKKKQNIRLFNGNVIDMFENKIWKIKNLDENNKLKWSRILSFMIKSEAEGFQYALNINPKILKEIEPIEFSNLKEMNLFSVGIENYEPLTFLSAPCLEYLNIIYNNNPNFKAFNKMNLPQLKTLCIYVRKIATQFEEMHFSIQDFDRWGFNLTQLRLEKYGHDAVTMQDLSKLAKSKPSLNNVYYFNSNRVNQSKVRDILSEQKKITFHIAQKALNNLNFYLRNEFEI